MVTAQALYKSAHIFLTLPCSFLPQLDRIWSKMSLLILLLCSFVTYVWSCCTFADAPRVDFGQFNPLIVLDREEVQLTCNVEAYPAVTPDKVLWFKDGNEIGKCMKAPDLCLYLSRYIYEPTVSHIYLTMKMKNRSDDPKVCAAHHMIYLTVFLKDCPCQLAKESFWFNCRQVS